jgi:hypothetical protein
MISIFGRLKVFLIMRSNYFAIFQDIESWNKDLIS